MDLEELKREYENLKGSHSNLLDNNFQLKQELEDTRGQIDIISLQNSEVYIKAYALLIICVRLLRNSTDSLLKMKRLDLF